MRLMEYLNKFWSEINDYRIATKPQFNLPKQEKLFLSEIVEFLSDYRISSTDIGICVASNQLEAMIDGTTTVINNMDTRFLDNIERYPELNNIFKKETLRKAIEKGEQQTKKVCGKFERRKKIFASFLLLNNKNITVHNNTGHIFKYNYNQLTNN